MCTFVGVQGSFLRSSLLLPINCRVLCECLSGIMTDELRNFLELNLPKVKDGKKPKFTLGVGEPKIGSHVHEATQIPCQYNDFVLELIRGVRLHFERFLKDLKVRMFSSVLIFLFDRYPLLLFLGL